MTKYSGKVNLGYAIHPTGRVPIDDRTVVEHYSGLTAQTLSDVSYDGMIVSVLKEKKAYLRVTENNITTWIPLGSNISNNDTDNTGIGTIVVDNYFDALSYATSDNIGLFIYITEDGTYKTLNYTAGPYVVSGVNKLTKINITDYTNLISGATYNNTSVVQNNTIILDNFITTSGLSGITYTKTEIDNKLKTIDLFSVVTELPTGEDINPNKIYLINNSGDSGNTFTEYIFVNTGDAENPSYVSEVIGSLSVETDFTNYYTKSEIDGKLTTTSLTLTESVTGDTENETISSGVTLQSVFQNIWDRIKTIKDNGDDSTSTITNLSGASGITVDLTAETPTISVNVSTTTGNALEIKDDGLYVESLVERLTTLENLLSAFTGNNPAATLVSSDNIASAITACISDNNNSVDDDIQVTLENGKLKITLNSITNIAYNDATPINNENGEN